MSTGLHDFVRPNIPPERIASGREIAQEHRAGFIAWPGRSIKLLLDLFLFLGAFARDRMPSTRLIFQEGVNSLRRLILHRFTQVGPVLAEFCSDLAPFLGMFAIPIGDGVVSLADNETSNLGAPFGTNSHIIAGGNLPVELYQLFLR